MFRALHFVNNIKETVKGKYRSLRDTKELFLARSKEKLGNLREMLQWSNLKERIQYESSYLRERISSELSYRKALGLREGTLLGDIFGQQASRERVDRDMPYSEAGYISGMISSVYTDLYPKAFEDIIVPTVLTGYFRDQKTKIDLVIVMKNLSKSSKHRKIFKRYLTGAIKNGLQVELEPGRMPVHRHLLFIKVNAPDDVIRRFGHIFHHERHFQTFHVNMIQRFYRRIRKKMPLAMMDHERAYLRIIRENYPGPDQYSTLERSRVVWELLSSANFGNMPGEGVNQLLKMRAVIDAYAVHDGPFFLLENQYFSHSNARQILFEFWTGITNIFRMQPLHIIHEYFGEKIGIFFAFYGMYNMTMFIIAVFGFFVWFVNLFPWPHSEVTKMICAFRRYPHDYLRYHDESRGIPPPSLYKNNIWICSNCKHYRICPHRYLYDFCNESKYIESIETNARLFSFPLVCFICSLLFVSCWKRKERFLLWFWEVDAEFVKNMLRSNCLGISNHLESSFNYRLWKFIWNVVQLGICLFLAFLMLHYLLHYRYYLMQQYEVIKDFGRRKYVVTTMLGVVHMVMVVVVERVSHWMIFYMLQLEELDTYDARDRAWAWRMFFVSFIFTFVLITYTAFIKGQFYTTPIDDTYINYMGGVLMENCDPFTCIDEVVILITVIIVMRELILKFIPYVRIFGFTSDYSLHYNYNKWPYWEREKKLFNDDQTERFLQQKYKDIVMQFAAVTLFVGMWPLAPAVGFITSAIDLRYCARRLLLATRRPILRKCEGIGSWQPILLLLVFLMGLFQILTAVITSDTILRINPYLHKEPDVYDHIDYFTENNLVTDVTIINGYPHHIDTQTKIGHIPLVILPEIEYHMHNPFLSRQYQKYVQIHDLHDVICQWKTPDTWPPIRYVNCRFAYRLTPFRHCYFRGFLKRYASYHPTANSYMERQHSQAGTISTKWYKYSTEVWIWTTRKITNIHAELLPGAKNGSTLHPTYGTGTWKLTMLWHYTVRIFADVYKTYGYAYSWQERYVSMLKWLYASACTGLMCIVIVLVYWCWPDESSMVTEGRAYEKPYAENYPTKRRRVKIE